MELPSSQITRHNPLKVWKKEKCHRQKHPFLGMFYILWQNSERERERAAKAQFVGCRGSCNCICSLKRWDLAHPAVRSASIWVFHPAHVSGSLRSFLHSGFTAGIWTSISQEGQCPCFLLLPTQEEHETRWWGKGPLFHCASHKPPIKHPVSKHSPPLSSFHAVYPTPSKNTNPTQPCQSHFLSKGLCEQTKLAVTMYVAPTACKAFASLAKTIRFPLGLSVPCFFPYYASMQMWGRRCCSAPPYPPENTPCCTIKAIWWPCCASLAITASRHHDHLTPYSWQVSGSRMDNVKGGSSGTHRTPSRHQHLPF